jgi:hypothetical protein
MSQVGGSELNHSFIHYLDLQVVATEICHLCLGTDTTHNNMRLDFYHKGVKHFTRIYTIFGA